MLTVEKLKKMQPGEIFASGEGIDDGKIFNIWGEGYRIKWVAVRGKGYHDRAIYYHIINPKSAEKAKDQNDLLLYLYHSDWGDDHIASNGDKLTRESTIKAIVPCDDKAFDLYRY